MSSAVCPESEVFSDDSGVDVKVRDAARRNRRKSSEPKRRKEVLLMRRFRWDTDEEDANGTHFERPSSGDSGLHLEEEEEGEEPVEKKQKRRREEEERESVICSGAGQSSPDAPQDDVPPRCNRRNYKSMSRQRRIEANARERSRVHTISAAFEALRRAVPAYAHNQKLSKLAVLRIASAYIVALACLNTPHPEGDMPGCVEQCTRTIQAEGRSRRRSYKD